MEEGLPLPAFHCVSRFVFLCRDICGIKVIAQCITVLSYSYMIILLNSQICEVYGEFCEEFQKWMWVQNVVECVS